MPEGVSLLGVASVLVPVAVVTLLLRALPFWFVKRLRGNELVGLLGVMMPVGVMTVLVVYTVLGQKSAPGGVGLAVGCGLLTLGLHVWRRNAGLSILVGTALYVALVNTVFA